MSLSEFVGQSLHSLREIEKEMDFNMLPPYLVNSDGEHDVRAQETKGDTEK